MFVNRTLTHWLVIAGLAVASIVSLAPVQAADSLVVYSGRSDKFIKPVIEAFTRDAGIKVVLHSAKSTALLNKLKVEGKQTAADLYISNDAGNLQTGSNLGLFRALPDELVKDIEPGYRAPDNTWVGLSARVRVLVVSTKPKVDTSFVKSVFDLANPKLKGRLGITDSTNGSYIAGVTVYQRTADKEKVKAWLKGMKANVDGKVYAKHSKIVKAVASGKKDIGLVNHYYIYRHLDKHPDAPIRIVIPDQGENGMGVAQNVAGIAISKHTSKSVLAEKLVAYLASNKGQKMFADANREYPVLKDVPAAKEVPVAGSYKIADVPMHELATYRSETLDLLDDIGMP